MKFLKILASTAQLERLFSQWGYVHNDIRNRLSVDTSKKLVNIYFTLRSKDEMPDDFYFDDIDDWDIDIDNLNEEWNQTHVMKYYIIYIHFEFSSNANLFLLELGNSE